MNKNLRFFIALSVVMVAASGCKTKQKIVEIPAGAKIEAVAPITEATQKTAQPVKEAIANEREVTRNENFKLADGESSTDALKFKYHVVVGSFSKKENAKGLQSTFILKIQRKIS